ncbi:MAG TPA: IS1182 family transposase [archaeon]|nr:IS1182 family transposase [archaeon]
MSHEIRANYDEQFLLPPSLDEWVAGDHPVRFIRVFVDALDMKALGFKERESEEGRPNYASDLLLKVWLYGYFERIYSTRALEKACKVQLPIIWLTGMNYPDHNTLWRFFRDNRQVIRNVFKQSVRVALKGEMVGLVLQAIDGTKIRADVSQQRLLNADDLKRILKRLDGSAEEVCGKIESSEREESKDPEYKLPEKLQDKERLQRLIRDGLDEMSEDDKREMKEAAEKSLMEMETAGIKYLSVTDGESRMMKNAGLIKFSYNAQVVVDEKARIIVASEVTMDEADNHQLTGMINQAKENTGKVAEETVGDGGYFSGEEIHEAAKKGYPVLVNLPERMKEGGEFGKDKFKYDEGSDRYICPKGGELKFAREKWSGMHRNFKVRLYRCRQWRSCPFKGRCSTDKRGRGIERSEYDASVERQIEKQLDDYKQKLLRRRGEIVEPVFGWVKGLNKFLRWTFRGKESVNAQWQLICTVINLKKLHKQWSEGNLKMG